MDISFLLQSTYFVGTTLKNYQEDGINRYRPSYTFSKKPFGQIYLQNLVSSFKTDERIIEIVMLMGVATDFYKNAHRVAVALKNVNFEPHNTTSLCSIIKNENEAFKELPNSEIIEMILRDGIQPLDGRTIIQKSTTERKFIVIQNQIPIQGVDISVNCSCSNYFYSWAWYNSENGCHIGKRPPPYKRKNVNPNEPITTVRNPSQRPGVCKHLLLLIGLLTQGGLIKEIPSLTPYIPNLGASPIIRPDTGDIDIYTSRLKKVDRTHVDSILIELKDRLKALGQRRTGFNN